MYKHTSKLKCTICVNADMDTCERLESSQSIAGAERRELLANYR